MNSIEVKQIGKAYKKYSSRWARLAEWLSIKGIIKHKLMWVIKDISFTVEEGEALGIIGINGAGKSTLLKMIAGTTRATTGTIHTQGRVAALLELGLGFHPDFTGRQNVMLSGQLMGLSQSELNNMMPEIEAFAEIGEYIDQPVRVYSSGMQMRLAFSVATAKRPEILIVDEALSVGDTYFQHKSFNRIRDYRKQGTTLLIVSHDKSSIQAICDRAILLNDGVIAMEGLPSAVMDYYNAIIAEKEKQTVKTEITSTGQIKTTSGTGEASISKLQILNKKKEPIEVIDVGQEISLEVDVDINKGIDALVLGYVIKDRLGQNVFGTNTHRLQQTMSKLKAGEKIKYQFNFSLNLGEGSYSISVALHAEDTHLLANYEWRDLALMFDVVNTSKQEFVGVAWLPPEASYQRG